MCSCYSERDVIKIVILNISTLLSILFRDEKIEEMTESAIDVAEEHDFNSRYNSIMNILYVIDSYLEIHPEKSTFSSKLNVNILKVSELVSDEATNDEMEFFVEILVVLTTICPKKDYYLEKMEEMADETINFFLNIIDKYIIVEEVQKTQTNPKLSIMRCMERKSTSLEAVKSNEKEIIALKNEIKDLSYKNQDLIARMEAIKQKEELISKHEEELNQYTLEFNKMKENLVNRDSEIEELKQIININSKKYLEEMNTLREKLESATSIESELKNTTKENEKYKQKIKELMVYKNKAEEQENLKQVIDSVMTENELLKKEKHTNIHKIEVLSNSNNSHLEKIKELESEKTRILLELDEANRDLYKMERTKKKGGAKAMNRLSTYMDQNLQLTTEGDKNKQKLTDEYGSGKIGLDDIDALSDKNITDGLKTQEDDNVIELEWEKERERINREREKDNELEALKKDKFKLENQIFELKSEIFEIKSDLEDSKKKLFDKEGEVDRYRNQAFDNNKINSGVDTGKETPDDRKIQNANLEQIIVLENDIKLLTEDKRKLLQEKNKFELEVNKLKMELDKIKISNETEKLRLTEELKELRNKYDEVCIDKSTLTKELEESRNQISNNNSLVNKMLDEKMALMSNENKNKDQLMNERSFIEAAYKERIEKLEKEVAASQSFLKRSVELEYKLEQSLKDIKGFDEKLRAKELKIKGLEEQIIKKEERIKTLVLQIKENNEVYYSTLEKKQRDITYYKKLVEEQQIQFTKENDLILNKLFELSLQFNALKCDWDKKIEDENQCL